MADEQRDGRELLAEGEAALHRGDSEAAFAALSEAARAGIEDLDRLAVCLAQAGRFLGRHREVLDWIEAQVAAGGQARARLLRARIGVCRHVDVPRVLELAEEALAAADEEGDQESLAAVLADAAFAAYREGATRRVNDFAERAAARTWTQPLAAYFAVRARLFAASARGDLEEALRRSEETEALAHGLGRPADAANEANNSAECHLALGQPGRALAAARRAEGLAQKAGHRRLEAFARVLGTIACAESGDLDEALAAFEARPASAFSPIQAIDAAAARAFWLLERSAGGDIDQARAVALEALAEAHRVGVSNRLTALHGQIARSAARRGDLDEARAALEEARRAADRAEPTTELLLALSIAEVLPAGDPQRRVALGSARARILRAAGRRTDPRAYCTGVRLHRRLLELSGGVPADLPAEPAS